MCGIVGFMGKRDVTGYILDGLSRLEYRGYDSAGIAVISEGRIKTEKTVERIAELSYRAENRKGLFGNLGIGHTRWATHGAVTEENAHPHLSYDRKFALVHNGIIENCTELKEELMKKGVRFNSDTDTEVIVHLLANNFNGDLLAAVEATTERLVGSYALGIICTEFPDRMIAAKSGSPLIVGMSQEGGILASDAVAIAPYTKRACRLEDGEVCVITDKELTFYKNGRPIEKTFEEIRQDMTEIEKGEFEHFMLKEIFEQPEVAKRAAEKRIKDGRAFLDELNMDAAELSGVEHINIVACGSAYHAGMVGKYILERLLKLDVSVDIASEFRYRSPLTCKNALTVLISQSGETADTIAAAKEAKRLGGKTLAIVNVMGSTLSKVADHTLYTDAGPEIAVATTKGYTSQIITLCLFGMWAAQELGTANEDELDETADALTSLPEMILRSLSTKDTVKELAKRLCCISSLFFIGRNVDYAVAMEASLKLKEISYIHSEAYAAGELKHGSIALIEKGTTVVAVNCYEPLLEKTISNIREVKARGAFVIALCNEGDTATPKVADEVIFVPKAHPMLEAVSEAIPLQLFAYFAAVYKGADIDKPRNLAKSVTVE